MSRPRRASVSAPVASSLEAAVLRHARKFPDDGQAKAAAALSARGFGISPAGVRYIWRKHGLETASKRLKAVVDELPGGRSLTPAQQATIRRGEAREKFARKSRRAALAEERFDDSGPPADDRRRHILLAAAELFVERGYAGTSMRDIARRVGLLPGSIYYYFSTKDDLFVAVNQEGFSQITRRIEAALEKISPPWDRLEAACAAHLDAVNGHDAIARITGTALFGIHDEKLQRRLRSERARYGEIFRRLIGDLDLPAAVDPTMFRLALFGALNWSRIWYRSGDLPVREIARRFMALFGRKPPVSKG